VTFGLTAQGGVLLWCLPAIVGGPNGIGESLLRHQRGLGKREEREIESIDDR
jgi:hypothetical protein